MKGEKESSAARPVQGNLKSESLSKLLYLAAHFESNSRHPKPNYKRADKNNFSLVTMLIIISNMLLRSLTV